MKKKFRGPKLRLKVGFLPFSQGCLIGFTMSNIHLVELQPPKKNCGPNWVEMIFSILMSLSVHSNLLVLPCFQFIFELAFLKILQNWQGNTCVRASFLKEVATLLKKRPWHRYFPGIFTKILRTAFFKDYFY